HQHFAAGGERGDAGADVNRDAADLRSYDLALARVQSGPDVEPELPHPRADLAGGPDAAGRSVESRKKAVARGVDLAAAKARQLPADQAVMGVEPFSPAAVAQLGGAVGGIDDVGKQHGREDAIVLGIATRPGDELLDLVDDGVGVADPGRVIRARELDVLRA